MKLSKKSRKIIDEFAEAARTDGWTSDQGSMEAAFDSEEEYRRAEAQLEKHILNLEKRIKKLKSLRGAHVKDKNSN